MQDPYFAEFSSEGLMTSEERRRLSLLNYAQSKAAKNRKKKKKKQQHAQKKLTEAERRAKEQERIREEREMRHVLSEINRREAAAGTGTVNPEEPDKPEEPDRPLLAMPADEGNDINIDIPAEPPAAPPAKKAKAKKTQKKKTAGTANKYAARGARFSGTATAAAYPNRITTGGAVTLGILTGVLIGTVIYGRVQTNEIYTEIAEKQAVLDDLNAKNISMKSEMEGKMTVKNIEEYAENELHLMHLNQSQIEYIQLQTEDEVVISEPEDNFFVVINDYLVSFWEFLRGK